MIRVLYIAPEYPAPGENAAQVRANALLPRLRQQADLRVLAFPPHGVPVSTTTEAGVHFVARAEVGPARLVRATLSPHPRAFVRYDTPGARWTLRHLLDDFQPDVVHFDTIGTMALLDVVLAAPRRPKIVAHTHDAVSQLYRRLSQSGSVLRRTLAWTEYRKYRAHERQEQPRTDAIIVDSPEDAEYLARATGGHFVAIVPIGVDLQTFRVDGPRAQLIHPALVFSGSMGSVQSADAAAFLVKEVMPLVWVHHPKCQLYLVGNRPLPEVRALASERVHVTGFVEDLSAYLRGASVYVCPLRLGSGMRTRVIEALACGVPTVATPMALRGLADPRDGAGAPWLAAETAEGFAAEIHAILLGRHTDISSRARAYAQHNYSWDAVARSILNVYQEIGAS
ncbi:MAG: glycosyltransferase family 4 protein [Pseudomonadota bacterium]